MYSIMYASYSLLPFPRLERMRCYRAMQTHERVIYTSIHLSVHPVVMNKPG